jgi:soluble lytic murein transglycosylase-like protein
MSMLAGRSLLARLAALALSAFALAGQAGQQMYEPMSESVRAALHAAVSDRPPLIVREDPAYLAWRGEMSQRLARWLPSEGERLDLLNTVHYEATRAGLDPQLVLGLIEVESAFRKYAVSSAGARGYMQIMPFWIGVIGRSGDNLFHMRTNLRYGCIILRHYLDIEKGNLFRALGRYNGSLGKASYPNRVRAAWEGNWTFVARTQPAHVAGRP